MYINRIIMYLFVCLILSCYQENARYPIDHAKKSFLNNSAERNKLLLAREEIMIKKALEKENSLSFKLSEKGFFYAYMNKSSEKNYCQQRVKELFLNIKLKT